ncbi:MAG: biopolymer transporter ExbD [Gammaproteobacteria bacterium]
MHLQTRLREQPEINLTSLIDVVLLLLVFFMVSTSFVKEAEIKILLPEADLEPTQREIDAPLEIVVSAGGAYLVNGRQLVNNRRDTLYRAMRAVAGTDKDVPVTIRADASASHQAVVTVMEVAGQLGFTRVRIATVNPQR